MITLTILIVILCISLYVNINLFRKIEAVERELELTDNSIDDIYESISNAYDRMKSIDRIGSFESDDESGYIFKEIKSAIEQLNTQYNLDGEEA